MLARTTLRNKTCILKTINNQTGKPGILKGREINHTSLTYCLPKGLFLFDKDYSLPFGEICSVVLWMDETFCKRELRP